MAGSAAAITGARHGRSMASALALGRERTRVVHSTDEAVRIFQTIFASSRGNSHEKFRCALRRTPTNRSLVRYSLDIPRNGDVQFLSKVADLNKDGVVTPEEAAFSFRVWLCWHILHVKIQKLYSRLDADGDGVLDADELEPYLVELNDGAPVTKTEVFSVIRRADANGDNSLDITELTFATAVWYADIQGKKCLLTSQAMGKARQGMTAASNMFSNVSQVVRTSVLAPSVRTALEIRSSLSRNTLRTSRFSTSTMRTTITSRSSFTSSNSSRSRDSMYSAAESELTASDVGFASAREDDQAGADAHDSHGNTGNVSGASTPPTPRPVKPAARVCGRADHRTLRPYKDGSNLSAYEAAASAPARFAEIRDRGFSPPDCVESLGTDGTRRCSGKVNPPPGDMFSYAGSCEDSTSSSSRLSGDEFRGASEAVSAEQGYPMPPPLLRFNCSDDVELMRSKELDDDDGSDSDACQSIDVSRHRPSTASTSL
eukprot:TRINITY_DN41788_c0_g1_i2.p1 TRINITY_DN41788_c0_g1~~TRINITY_DN41788_c0_g1_i2.p1  ORF type:complete len:487 (-),score=71.70 TRINITY_DN41788_c0_g1_i2:236-1696(-)